MFKKLICLVSFVLVLGLNLTDPANAADPNLVGYWPLDESADDWSGYDNHGTIHGNPEWVAGKYLRALQFDGVDDYVGCGNDASLNITGPLITLEAWVKPNRTSGYDQAIVGKWNWTNNRRSYALYILSGATARFMLSEAGTLILADDSVASATTVVVDEWCHIAGVSDGTRKRIFINGIEEASNSAPSNLFSSTEPVYVGSPDGNAEFFQGIIDEVRIYNRALTQEEIQQTMTIPEPHNRASYPEPLDWAIDVPRGDVVLSWRAGDFADKHDVYFGTSFDDVNNTTNLDPMGADKVYRARQGVSSYDIPERLDLGQTYYWRVDEVNAPPTSHVVFKGDVWSFTTESFAYPIENIAATASTSSFNESTGPENTVDGSGLDADDLHSVEAADIWLTGMTAQPPIWIQYQFDKVYKLYQMWVWNFNQTIEPLVGFGLKDVTVEYSADGTDWTQLAGVPEFARAPGTPGYEHNTTVDFAGVGAKYVKITANDNWGFLTQYGLSEVRFFYIPVLATEPDPVSGATDVSVDATLGFRAGREAVKHDVYLSSDEQALIDGTADVTTVTEASYGPLSLDLAKSYYWRVDEVNEAETPASWQGDIWEFVTQEYLVVDDFESYDDYEPNRIFDTWIDGWGVPANGATIGYPNPIFVLDEHFVERTIVHGGRQSTPLFYDNTAGATYSEVTRTVDAPRDWTQAGVKALTLWFYGDPNNSATEQIYVKVNGSKVTYDSGAENITRTGWQMWYIDLAGLGVNLANITKLTIGLERRGAIGGKGVVYFDDIRLSPYDRQLVTPAEPDTAGLVAHWPLDEGSGTTVTDASGNGRDGTFNGNPQWVAGHNSPGALNFDGVDDSVTYRLGEAQTWAAYTVALWVKAGSLGQSVNSSMFCNHLPNTAGFQLDVDGGSPGQYRYRGENGGTRNYGPVTTDWVHIAVVCDGTTTTIYYSGIVGATFAGSDAVFNKFSIGINRNEQNWFEGILDDLRVYDRALTQDEIAWLASRTTPFDKPF